MLTSSRSWIAALFLAVAFALAGPATAALGHTVPACRNPVPDVMNPHCQPGHLPGDTDGDGDEDEDDPEVQGSGSVTPQRADTGAGGTAGPGSQSTVLLVGGGLLALGAAFGVRRATRGGGGS